VLIIEVLSRETFESDLNLKRGKGYSYARAGMREYLTLDPAYRYAPEGGVGWRLVDGEYRPWRREIDGRWLSQTLPLAFGLEGAWVAVYAADGHRFLREGEVERTLRERDTNERRLREALEEQERLRREYAAEVEQLRRRLEETERGR
jgi:hypothetical protein